MFFKYRGSNFIFYHYPKTGGSTIKYNIIKNKIDYIPNHNELSLIGSLNKIFKIKAKYHNTEKFYKKNLKTSIYKKSVKIASVRNPYDRVISLYNWIKRGSAYNDKLNFEKKLKIKKYVSTLNRDYFLIKSKNRVIRFNNMSFNDFVLNFKKNTYPYEYSEFTKLYNLNEIDHLIKLENFKKDLKEIFENYNLKVFDDKIKINQTSTKINRRDYYNFKTKNMIYNLFKNDIITFDYKF